MPWYYATYGIWFIIFDYNITKALYPDFLQNMFIPAFYIYQNVNGLARRIWFKQFSSPLHYAVTCI